MPPKRSTDRPTSENGSQEPRRNGHVTRACDECRKRMMRCNGARPRCQLCVNRDAVCEYNDEDKRRTNLEQIEQVKNRMDRLERMIQQLVDRDEAQAASNTVPGQAPIPVVLENPIGPHAAIDQSISAGPHPTSQGVVPTAGQDPGPSPTWSFGASNAGVSHERTTASRMPLFTPGHRPSPHETDRFQRVDGADGTLVQHGATSLWSYRNPVSPTVTMSTMSKMMPGDWVDWSKNLPSSLNIDKASHDKALAYFGAYYAPWCLTVDMPAFYADLSVCNMVRPTEAQHRPPTRTAHYSPLLHLSMLFMGLFMTRREHSAYMRSLEAVFVQHGAGLLMNECDHATFSSLRAYNLYANCLHNLRLTTHSAQFEDRQNATGYIYSGMAIAAIHQLGLNVDCQDYVRKGDITGQERLLRHDAFWTVFVQDAVRAFAAGRPSMLAGQTEVPLPTIDRSVDEVLWEAPNGSSSLMPLHSMRSTVFHWTARLMVLGRTAVDQLYDMRQGLQGYSQNVELFKLSNELDTWYAQYPLTPVEAHPVPHALILVMMYHLLRIFVFRPFYRSDVTMASGKCDDAAESILRILRSFDQRYGTHLLHHNVINVIFGASTVFLLQGVGAVGNDSHQRASHERFREAIDFLAKLSVTWSEARTGRQILLHLCREYLPHLSPTSEGPMGPTLSGQLPMPTDFINNAGSGAQTLEYPTDPDELIGWLSGQDLWSFPMPDQNTFGF